MTPRPDQSLPPSVLEQFEGLGRGFFFGVPGVALVDATEEQLHAELDRRLAMRNAEILRAAEEHHLDEQRRQVEHLDARVERVRRRWNAKRRPQS